MSENVKIGVKNHINPGETPKRVYQQQIKAIARLGKEIKISPKANITINEAGFKTEFFVETVNVLIGIGKDHVADLVMSLEAWEALKGGAEVSITTTEEFKKKFIYSK